MKFFLKKLERVVWERFVQMKIERLCMSNSSTLIKVFVTSVCTHGLMLLTNLSSFSNHDEYCGAKKSGRGHRESASSLIRFDNKRTVAYIFYNSKRLIPLLKRIFERYLVKD